MSDILEDLFEHPLGVLSDDAEATKFDASTVDQVFNEHGRQMRWAGFSPRSNTPTLLPQSLYFKADTTGRDPNMWKAVLWLYNNITYESTGQFRNAWQTPGFHKLIANHDGIWTQLEPDGMPIDSDDHSRNRPPQMVQPGGSRIFLDEQRSFVSWTGISFNFAFSQVNGVALSTCEWTKNGSCTNSVCRRPWRTTLEMTLSRAARPF